MTALQGIVTWLGKLQANFKSAAIEQAEYFLRLDEIKTEIEIRMEPVKKALIENGETFLFPEDRKKVAFVEAASKGRIDVGALYDFMAKCHRLEDFISVCSVSMTDLKKLPDGEGLEGQFKVFNGDMRSASVSVQKMTKKELKESGIED